MPLFLIVDQQRQAQSKELPAQEPFRQTTEAVFERSNRHFENQQRPDQAIGCRYNRHFYIIYRGGRYARISWRDGTTYELSTAKMEAGNLQWQITDAWRLGIDEKAVISGSTGRTLSHTEAVRNFLMLLEA